MARKKITDEQLQEELNAGVKNIDIARKYGISDRVIRIRKAKLAKKGVGHGRDVSHLVPDGYKIKGTSSLVDEFGNTKLQWVKTDTDAERQIELMGEGHRYFDLRRWLDAPVEESTPIYGCNTLATKEMADVFHTPVAVPSLPTTFSRKMWFWPINHTELKRNKRLTQNPGWTYPE